MKLYLLSLVFLVVVFVSCNKTNELDGESKPTQIEVAGEGGETQVELGGGDWRIASVINANGNQRMFGDAHTLEGEVIWKNKLLELDGLGSLTSSGIHRGFHITHESPGTISILLEENGTGEAFRFVIVLQKGNETREITIDQPASAGYRFDSIEYFLDEGDGDSSYVRNALVTYQFTHLAPREVEISPFAGPNVIVNSHFESDDRDAFVWLANHSVEVSVPADIRDGAVYLAHEKRVYGAVSNEPYRPDITVTVQTPEGQSRFATNIEERRRTVSYKLSLTSNATGETKEIIGKWFEISPTGVYEIKRLD